jgi:hypothetical protein
MDNEFDSDIFLQQLSENTNDLKDYNTIRAEVENLLEKLILEGKIQNKSYTLAIAALLISKDLVNTVFKSKEDMKTVYEKVLKIEMK